MTVKLYIEKPNAPEWDPKKQTADEYQAEHCIPWDSLTPEEQRITAEKLNNMAMKALGYKPSENKGGVA